MGKLALITGASSGIGAAIAKVLAGRGIQSVLVARRVELLEKLRDEIISDGGVSSVYSCDVTDRSQVKKLSSQVLAAEGVPDFLINNVGAGHSGYTVDAEYDKWDQMIDVNIRGQLHILGQFLPGMKNRGTGHVINMSATWQKEGIPGVGVFCGTKHFWGGMSEAMRKEMIGTDVRVTDIMPGFVLTDMLEKNLEAVLKIFNLSAATFEKKKGKMILPKDVAEVVYETLTRPGQERFYQTEVMMKDQFLNDGEVMAEMSGGKK
jgi:serine 3-dehydrogenase